MRQMLRALVGMFIVAWYCSTTTAAESGSWWWPFNRQHDASSDLTGNSLAPGAAHGAQTLGAPSATQQYPTSAPPGPRWFPKSPLKMSRPRIHLPEIALPKPRLPGPQLFSSSPATDNTPNAWMQTTPEPSRFSPLQSVKRGAQRVGSGTRVAWHKTVDVLTPGDANFTPPQVGTGSAQPSLLKRMLGHDEPPQQGPRTVTEWMAQDRLDP